MSDVFISYAREDKERASSLASMLEANGFTVQFDRALLAGDEFDEKLPEWIDAARAVVVLWSRQSMASMWVKYEANRALEQDKLCPISFDGPDQIPAPFPRLHTIDFGNWSGDTNEPCAKQLLRAVHGKLGSTASHTNISGTAAQPSPDRNRRALLAVPILAVVLLGVGFLWKQYQNPAQETGCYDVTQSNLATYLDDLGAATRRAGAAQLAIDVVDATRDQIIHPDRVIIGQKVKFKIESPVDGQLILINVNAANDVTQIYPNKYTPNDADWKIPAGTHFVIPTAKQSGYSFTAQPPTGLSLLVGIVVPEGFPMRDLVADETRLARGFQAEAEPLSYLAPLTQQITDLASSTGANTSEWAYTAKSFCFAAK